MSEPAIAAPDLPDSRGTPPRRRLRWLGRIAMMVAGLAIGLAAAEIVFRVRDGGAFPHLNVYVADPALGVRLAPGGEQKISFGGNPITHVRINRDGFRGGEPPAPGPDEVLVVGDSQVFGLGVEEDEAFSAGLARALHRTVINAGVPTYGPDEYRQVIAEQLAGRHPRTVVLTINLVNDLFEAQHANRDRHRVWDGWAVRKETAPASVIELPGRALLYRDSHLFFALRKWWRGEDHSEEGGVASEGTWRDVVASGAELETQRTTVAEARKKHLEDITASHAEVASAETRLDDQLEAFVVDDDTGRARAIGATYEDRLFVAQAHASPGDIVADGLGEESRASAATADQIATAVRVRDQLRKRLAAWAQDHHNKDARTVRDDFAALDRATAKLTAVDVEKLQLAVEPPLAGYLRDVQQLVEHAGARLVVVVLPLDVQVSADEWKKYAGATPIDMTATRALADELVSLCHARGVSAIDATPVLAAAEPGAFLDKDIHMTAKGHAAVATALAAAITAPPPRALTAAMTARSPLPLPDVYRRAPEVIVTGSSDASCETKQVREWLRIRCARTELSRPRAIELTRDDGDEAMALVMPDEMTLVVPVVEGRQLDATLTWNDRIRVLHIAWPAGGKPRFAFDKPVSRGAHAEPPDGRPFHASVERAICECWQRVFGGGRDQDSPKEPSCPGAYGAADPLCVAKYGDRPDRCAELLACTRRDPVSPR
jgi:hypothetical protein